jgi:hypothetical protein
VWLLSERGGSQESLEQSSLVAVYVRRRREMVDWIYRRYRAVLYFFSLVGRNGEGNWFYRSSDGCNGARFGVRESWTLAWEFWKDWPSHIYGRDWKP